MSLIPLNVRVSERQAPSASQCRCGSARQQSKVIDWAARVPKHASSGPSDRFWPFRGCLEPGDRYPNRQLQTKSGHVWLFAGSQPHSLHSLKRFFWRRSIAIKHFGSKEASPALPSAPPCTEAPRSHPRPKALGFRIGASTLSSGGTAPIRAHPLQSRNSLFCIVPTNKSRTPLLLPTDGPAVSPRRSPELSITKTGDPMMRHLLVQCAQYMLGRHGEDSALRRWGLRLAARGGKRCSACGCRTLPRGHNTVSPTVPAITVTLMRYGVIWLTHVI